MKSGELYIQVDRAQTPNGRKCNGCGRKIEQYEKYLHMNRNRHLFVLCGKCVVMYATELVDHDPIHKADAVAEMI